MTPFGLFLEQMLRDRGFQQKHLAVLVQVNPAYISTLISGKKGPPSARFVEKLVSVLGMSKEEVASLRKAIRQSNREIRVPINASYEEYILADELRKNFGSLDRAQVSAMRSALVMNAKHP